MPLTLRASKLWKMLLALGHSIWAHIADRCGRMGTGGDAPSFRATTLLGISEILDAKFDLGCGLWKSVEEVSIWI